MRSFNNASYFVFLLLILIQGMFFLPANVQTAAETAGIVLDAETNKYLKAANVPVEGINADASTIIEGSFLVFNFTSGKYSVMNGQAADVRISIGLGLDFEIERKLSDNVGLGVSALILRSRNSGQCSRLRNYFVVLNSDGDL